MKEYDLQSLNYWQACNVREVESLWAHSKNGVIFCLIKNSVKPTNWFGSASSDAALSNLWILSWI